MFVEFAIMLVKQTIRLRDLWRRIMIAFYEISAQRFIRVNCRLFKIYFPKVSAIGDM